MSQTCSNPHPLRKPLGVAGTERETQGETEGGGSEGHTNPSIRNVGRASAVRMHAAWRQEQGPSKEEWRPL